MMIANKRSCVGVLHVKFQYPSNSMIIEVLINNGSCTTTPHTTMRCPISCWYLSNDNTERSLQDRDQPKTIIDILHPTTNIQIMVILGGSANLYGWCRGGSCSRMKTSKCVSIWLRLRGRGFCCF
jgi:hypothetical protein